MVRRLRAGDSSLKDIGAASIRPLLSRSDRACTSRHEPWFGTMDHRAGILGIAALSGPSNLSRSQWTSRMALPTGFKRIPPTAGGKYRSALFDRRTRPLVSRTSPASRTGTGVYSGGIRLSFQYNDQYSLPLYYKIVFLS